MRIFLLGLLCALGIGAINCSYAEQPTEVGTVAPNWVLNDSNGNPVSLYQQADAGNTTVMVFWASWCQNCKTLLPALGAMQANKGSRPFEIYLMNVWEDLSAETLKEIAANELSVLVSADNVARRFGIGTTPGVIVVGPDRHITYRRTSGTSVSEVTEILQSLLPESSQPGAASDDEVNE